MRLLLIFLLPLGLLADNPKNLLRYIPANMSFVMGVDVEGLASVEHLSEILENDKLVKDISQIITFKPSELSSVIMASRNLQEGRFLSISHLREPMVLESLLRNNLLANPNVVLAETKFKGHPVYQVTMQGDVRVLKETTQGQDIKTKGMTTYISQISPTEIVSGSGEEIRQLLNLVKFAEGANLTLMAKMMNLVSDKEAIFFMAYGGDFTMQSGVQLGVPMGLAKTFAKDFNGLSLETEYNNEGELVTSLAMALDSPDLQVVFEKAFKKDRGQLKQKVKYGQLYAKKSASKFEIQWTLNDSDLLILSEDALKGLSQK